MLKVLKSDQLTSLAAEDSRAIEDESKEKVLSQSHWKLRCVNEKTKN